MGSAVADYMLEHGYSPRIVRMGIPDKYITQGTPAQLKRICGIDSDGIAAGIRKAVSKS